MNNIFKPKQKNHIQVYGTKIKPLFSQNRCELLAKSTTAEKVACKILTALKIKYIKQFPINTGQRQYYADIYIPHLKLVLEIDGGYHYTTEQKRKDCNRSVGIRRLGYHVYRLSNHDAKSPDKVKAKILRLIRSNHR